LDAPTTNEWRLPDDPESSSRGNTKGLFMNKFSIGFSILSTLLIGAGCTDEPSLADEAQTGTASFGLITGAFSLDAVFDISANVAGAPGAVVENDVTTVAEVAALEVDLAPGSYIPVSVSWTLFENGGIVGSSAVPAEVTFLGFSPSPFTIVSGETEDISMTFQIGTSQTVTVTTEGTGGFVLVTNEEECAEICAVGQVCAVIDQGPASCEDSCATPAVEDTEDCEGRACLAGTGGNVCDPAI
jgi:hypothetical protein